MLRCTIKTGLAVNLVGPYLGLLDALDCLWGSRATAPSGVEFVCADRRLGYVRMATGRYEAAEITRPLSEQGDVRIFLDCDRTPCEPLPEDHEIPAVVIRSTGVPVLVSDNPTGPLIRIEPFASCDSDEDRRAALEAVMRAVFAKPELREGQFEALAEVLAGHDCAVLLPTGAGKSMIYQLAGLCLPGSTLVVDPLVALMEDQIHGLRMHGIDRAVGISSRTRDLPREPGDAHFIFVTPERLQRQKFRNELAAAAQTTPVNLAVIDEAHCVSEWGHDFRPAYLNFGMTLRGACNGALGKPPLLALTGTASRAVLKDVLFQLGIRQENENSIVRPSTFDRPELSYRVVLATPDDSEVRLQGELRAMSGYFGAVAATFFEPTGRSNTYSGIVFVPTVNGWHGVSETWTLVRALVPTAVRYSGSDRRWNERGRNPPTWPRASLPPPSKPGPRPAPSRRGWTTAGTQVHSLRCFQRTDGRRRLPPCGRGVGHFRTSGRHAENPGPTIDSAQRTREERDAARAEVAQSQRRIDELEENVARIPARMQRKFGFD